MASWTDGPEYAPVERPDVFVAPDTGLEPLLASVETPTPVEPAETPATLAHDPGPARPDFAAAAAGVALEELGAPAPPRRDPTLAFDVATTLLTATAAPTMPLEPAGTPAPPAPLALPPQPAAWPPPGGWPPPAAAPASAWGATHAPTAPHRAAAPWVPAQPFPAPDQPPPSAAPPPWPPWPVPTANPPPFPTPDGRWGPPPTPTGPAPLSPVTFSEIWRAATPGVMITLLVGGLVPLLSFPLLLVASFLASRIRHRRVLIARAFSAAVFGVVGLGLVGALGDLGYLDLDTWYDASSGWAELACWAMALFTFLVVGDAVRRREPPEEGRP